MKTQDQVTRQRTQSGLRGWFPWTLVTLAVVAFSVGPLSAQVNHNSTLTGDGRQGYPPLGVAIPLTLTYNCNTPICYASPALSVTDNTAYATAVSGMATVTGTGVYGSGEFGVSGSGSSYGVFGYVANTFHNGSAVYGVGDGYNTGVDGFSDTQWGVYAETSSGIALNVAGRSLLQGDVEVTGTLSKSSGS